MTVIMKLPYQYHCILTCTSQQEKLEVYCSVNPIVQEHHTQVMMLMQKYNHLH